MMKVEGINSFVTRIQEVRDQLAVVGEAPQLSELVRLALDNVSEEWQVFVQSILGRDTFCLYGTGCGKHSFKTGTGD